ncbi:MAG: DUF4330 domain-containing protein [Oscillospiraceae bacterium]|nr:DUF4330 domain-containing protein [Oscillospiraceae bacterium]
MEKKKGMLFGKLNIIDAIIIIAVVLLVVFVGMRLLGIGASGVEPTKVRIMFFEEECPDFVPTYTHPGDTLFDGGESIYMGVVTDVIIDDAISFEVTHDGIITIGDKEGYCSVYITGEAVGILTDNGIVIGGKLYSVGHTMILHAGFGKYYLSIYSIEVIG